MMELERSKNIFGSGNEPVSNVYKPSSEITSKQVRPSFGIGDLRSNEQNQVKPMFNFNIKDNPQQQQNKFGKFDGKFIKLEDKSKQQQSYIQKPIPQKTDNKKDKHADPYSSDEKEEIQANNNVEYIDPFSDFANSNTGNNNNNNYNNSNNNNKGLSNDLDDIFGSYQTANPNPNLNNNNNFNVNELIKNNPIQSDDYDFTFKNENDPNKVIQNIKVDQSKSKLIENILNNSYPIQSNNFNVQSNINQGGFINEPIRNNSSFSNPFNSGVNYQDGTSNMNMNMNMGSNMYNQVNSNYIPNNSNSYNMNQQSMDKINVGFNYQNLQQQQFNNYNNTNTNTNNNMNMNFNNGNFNYPSTGYKNDVQGEGGNLDFFDTIKPNSNNFMNQNNLNSQINQNQPMKNNRDDLNKLDEFF